MKKLLFCFVFFIFNIGFSIIPIPNCVNGKMQTGIVSVKLSVKSNYHLNGTLAKIRLQGVIVDF